jgi:hypothetical protein
MSQKRQKQLRAWKELRDRAHDAAHLFHEIAHASAQPFVAELCRNHADALVDAILRVDRSDDAQ